MRRSRPSRPARSGPDYYEWAFDAYQRRRVQGTPDKEQREQSEPAIRTPPRPSWKWLVAAVVLVVVVVGFYRATSGKSPAIARSCSKPALALSVSSIAAQRPVLLGWSATGPHGQRFVLAADAAAVMVAGDGRPTAEGAGAQVLGGVRTMPGDCLDHGTIGVTLSPGRHAIGMFRISASTATEVAHVVLTATQ